MVSSCDSSDRGKKALFQSNLLKAVAQASDPNICSGVGNIRHSLSTDSLSLVRSTQRCMPTFLGATTIGAHQSSVTAMMTPKFSRWLSSSL